MPWCSTRHLGVCCPAAADAEGGDGACAAGGAAAAAAPGAPRGAARQPPPPLRLLRRPLWCACFISCRCLAACHLLHTCDGLIHATAIAQYHVSSDSTSTGDELLDRASIQFPGQTLKILQGRMATRRRTRSWGRRRRCWEAWTTTTTAASTTVAPQRWGCFGLSLWCRSLLQAAPFLAEVQGSAAKPFRCVNSVDPMHQVAMCNSRIGRRDQTRRWGPVV